MTKSRGARYQIIILKVHRDKNLKVRELHEIKQYLQANYSLVGWSYGSTKNSLTKTIKIMLEKNLVHNPETTLKEVIDLFAKKTNMPYGKIVDYSTSQQVKKFNEGVVAGLKKITG